ncbi:ABC transporter ATP-binding protein [Breznakiella homolactica]|uniref:ABC transporter ATP-binding protein n=1 Tax=Breznakiella homolactica TaxID=2798577 RepID=A0A7T7XMV6_9SPIR|nr:ABC transporter ATP-binding protein [Breznakiella homolactica]QQO09279.1 ABC transporter ATP-binding protein [Breznakiella homolactica]
MQNNGREPGSAGPALSFDGFTFKYRSQSEATLHRIRFSVRRGEKILIVGPSGSGKSTLAHCINGLIPHAFPGAASGNLTIGEFDALSLGIFDISKKVGTVLQDPDSQFVGLTAGEDIAFAAENDCIPVGEMKQRVLRTAGVLHIEGHLGKAPQDLSGGQKQRVSLAGVLMDEVDILLFDEPLANLDPAAGQETIELIDWIHKNTGKTILIVEHRLEDVLHRPVDRIVVIDQGWITADLPPGELLASDILRRTGIREPLYLTALRYAGETIIPEIQPDTPGNIRFDPEKLKQWDRDLPEHSPETQGPEILDIRGLSFHYPQDLSRTPVLEDISFTLYQGECVSLVGRNGAGKSTLAKIICGFNDPVTGKLRFDGRDLQTLSIKERSEYIGYVMQNPNQMISFPMIFDEAALGLRSRGMGEAEVKDRVYQTLQICGLYPFRNWPVSALSFGQKKRLTIASILVMGPSLLILDEPTAGQDFRHYSEIMEFLRTLNRNQGLSLLMITHDMHLMLEYTTRAIVLSGGRLLADAAPAEVLTDDAVIEQASLKRTSLYDLAVRGGIEDPRTFVQGFINFDRKVRDQEFPEGPR